MTSDDASQLARPNPQGGESRSGQRRWQWLAQYQPICLGIAELSQDGRAAFYSVRAPTHSHSTSGVAGEQVEVSHMQYSRRYLVSAKPSEIGAVHVFHLIHDRRT